MTVQDDQANGKPNKTLLCSKHRTEAIGKKKKKNYKTKRGHGFQIMAIVGLLRPGLKIILVSPTMTQSQWRNSRDIEP